MDNSNIYRRIKIMFVKANVMEETDKIKNIKYMIDEKSTSAYMHDELLFKFIKEDEEVNIHFLRTIKKSDYYHLMLSYDSKELSFYITGDAEQMQIRPNYILVKYSPEKLSDILEELEIAIEEAGGNTNTYLEEKGKFERICKEYLTRR